MRKIQTFFNSLNDQELIVNNFLNYVYSNMPDSVQSSDFCFPYTVFKDKAMFFLKEQTKDIIGSKCDYSFVSWDGYDGETPYTGFRLNISHNGYNDQVIVSTTNEIRCIFSVKQPTNTMLLLIF